MTAPPTAADLLAEGLRLPPLPEPPETLPPGTVCAITGQPIARGYPVAALVTEATADFLSAFPGGVHGHVAEAAARCFRSADPRKGNPCARSQLAFAGGPLYQPLINRAAAGEQGRPCWSDLVRAVWPARRGELVLAILTTNTKKRLWPQARTGALGGRTPLLLYDSATDAAGVRLLDWPALLDCLDLIEAVYSAGFAKAQIRASLYSAAAGLADLARARAWERALAGWRERPEFDVALLIAQRAAEPAPAAPAPPAAPAARSYQQGRLL
jgi:hypothetical protein